MLTEAAGDLLDLGFEDIYQDSRETIAASSLQGWVRQSCCPCMQQCAAKITKVAEGALRACRAAGADQNKRTFIWHDDGLTARKQHDVLDDVASFKDLPRSVPHTLFGVLAHSSGRHSHSLATDMPADAGI